MSIDYSEIPWCKHCGKAKTEHADGTKCLYDPASFAPVLCALCGRVIPCNESCIGYSSPDGYFACHLHCDAHRLTDL